MEDLHKNKNIIMMTTKQRKSVIRQVNILLKADKNYASLESGAKEVAQDEHLNRVCEEMGYTINEFYFEEGKKLEGILSNLI
jgi:hypothetical protein